MSETNFNLMKSVIERTESYYNDDDNENYYSIEFSDAEINYLYMLFSDAPIKQGETIKQELPRWDKWKDQDSENAFPSNSFWSRGK